MAHRSLDFIAIGRSSVDLYGQQVGGRLEDMASFAKYVGGSPTNTAIGAARLGLRTGLITRVGADHMGQFICETLEREGVDIRGVTSDPERLTALVVLGIRDEANFPLIFYRENCPDMALAEGDIDPAFIAQAAAVVLSGTHLSAPGVRAASLKAANLAHEGGARVVLDIDYRPVLWGLAPRDRGEDRFVADAKVSATLQAVLPLADLVVGSEEEMRIAGGSDDLRSALAAVRERTGALLVCKTGAGGCMAFEGAIPPSLEDAFTAPGFAVEVFNVLGAGDAFMAGFLRGWLKGEPLARCCALANGAGALVVSRHGCAPAMPNWAELTAFLERRPTPARVREDRELEHLHWAASRGPTPDELMVLAIDHRTQLESMAQRCNADPGRLQAFKSMALAALDRTAKGDDRFGILLDARYGSRALAAASDHPYWIGRPIEVPGSRPLAFEGGADVGAELSTWPSRQAVKCLVRYHPDDEAELIAAQNRQLLRLADACRKTGHELMIEVISPPGMASEETTVSRALGRIYDLGVYPDWWKLEPATNPRVWGHVASTIESRDALCRGVVVLGQSAAPKALAAAFGAAGAYPIVKGFAVGRTLFEAPLEAWLRGDLADGAAVADLAAGLERLVGAWRSARSAAERAA